MSQFHDLLTYSSPLILTIGVFFGFYFLKWIDNKSKLMLIYLLMSLAIDLASRIVLANSGNNLIFLSLHSVLELLIISIMYYHLGLKKVVLIPLTALGVIYIIGEIIYIDSSDIKSFQSYAKIVSSFVIVLFVFQFFIERMSSDKEISKETQRLNLVILFYFAINLILLLPINLIINQIASSIIYIWYAYLGATILFYSYISAFIWKNGKTRKQLSNG